MSTMSTQGALASYSPEYLAQDVGQRLLDAIFVTVAGAGRHIVYWLDTDPTVIATFLKIQTADEFIYMAGVTFPKVSILMLYLRIFVDRKVRITTWSVIGIVMGHWVATGIIADFTICQPFAFKWDKTIPGGHCTNLMAAYKYISIPNIVTDLAILILPFSTLYRLQMSRTRKIGISLTFLAGSLKLKSGSAVNNRYNARAAATRHLGDIPLGNFKGSNKTSVSVPQGPNLTGVDEGRAGFIRLQETVQVDYSSGASA